MATDAFADSLIASALQLPLPQRVEIVAVLQESLIDDSLDHGPPGPADDVAAAWDAEIARRADEIERSAVKLITAEEAERMIRSRARPEV